MKKLVFILVLVLFPFFILRAELIKPGPDQVYHIQLTKNEAVGLYELMEHCDNKNFKVQHGPAKKRDATIEVNIDRQHFVRLKRDESPYENPWNVTYKIKTTKAIHRKFVDVINSSGDSEFVQVKKVDGTTFITIEILELTWDPSLKELMMRVTYPATNIKNDYIEKGYYNIEASNKLVATASMDSKEKANAWSPGVTAGFSAQAHMEANHVIQVNVTINGSPFELSMGRVFIERFHTRSLKLKFAHDWTSTAYLNYSEEVQRAESTCASGWAKEKSAVYTLWEGGGSSSSSFKASTCLDSKVENLFAKIRWSVQPAYIGEDGTADDGKGVGISTRLCFVVDDLNLAAGKKAKAGLQIEYMSKLNWELDIEGFAEAFELGSSQNLIGVKTFPEVAFELK